MVEHSAVNRVVVGSSPTRGAWKKPVNIGVCRFFIDVPGGHTVLTGESPKSARQWEGYSRSH